MPLLIKFDSTDLVIWAICAGVCLAFIVNHIYKALVGPLVRTLIAYEHFSPETATTLAELKLNTKRNRFLLRDASPVMTYVSVVGDKIPRDENGKYDYEGAKFYVPQDKKEKASSAFAEPGRILPLIIFIALIIGCAYGLTKLVPILIALL
jgi:hypothetical protein